jgi:hypothetical protein
LKVALNTINHFYLQIFQLEGELGEAQKAAGLPILIPDPSQRVPEVIAKESSIKVESALG